MSEEQRLSRLRSSLRSDPDLPRELPETEAEIVSGALAGRDVQEIAADKQTSAASVWHVLEEADRMATGDEPRRRPVSGGMRSDVQEPGEPASGETELGFGLPSPAEEH
ncbi:MAG: hypothetical protein ACRDFS_04160 [Chloroflexota bacterium]